MHTLGPCRLSWVRTTARRGDTSRTLPLKAARASCAGSMRCAVGPGDRLWLHFWGSMQKCCAVQRITVGHCLAGMGAVEDQDLLFASPSYQVSLSRAPSGRAQKAFVSFASVASLKTTAEQDQCSHGDILLICIHECLAAGGGLCERPCCIS